MKVKEACVKRTKELMEKHGEGVPTFSKKAGIPASTIYSFFNEDRERADVNTIARLCEALDISLSEFFDSTLFTSKNAVECPIAKGKLEAKDIDDPDGSENV